MEGSEKKGTITPSSLDTPPLRGLNSSHAPVAQLDRAAVS